MRYFSGLTMVVCALVPGAWAADASVRAVEVRCEYLRNPLGLDVREPRLSWRLEATQSEARGQAQSAYQILVASTPENLAKDQGDLWDTGKVASDESIQHAYAGAALASRCRAYWKVRVWDEKGVASPWSDTAQWTMGLLSLEDWGAQWIGMPDAEAPSENGEPPIPPSPLLRRAFTVGAPIARATLYVTSRGDYECRINGRKVDDRVLAPEWTDYKKRIQYQTYDVTGMLQKGENAIGATLGDGWYLGRLGPIAWNKEYPRRGVYGPVRRLLARLEIECADGTKQTLVTDKDWVGTPDGPIRNADNFQGETYDARKEQPGWDAPGFEAQSWSPVLAEAMDTTPLVAQRNEPIRVMDTLPARTVTEPKPGVFVFDLGQNFAGWCRMKTKGDAGQALTLKHGEMLNPDGTVYLGNLRSAKQTDTFILAGKGEEVFEPHFTYHGFRYVEVTGLKSKPAPEAITGQVVCSSPAPVGSVECSNPLLNQILHNTFWTLRANLHSVPTDCPQRDERMGWMGDAQVFAQSAIFELDMAAFYTKWIQDIRDAQAKDGSFPDIAPHAFDPDTRFKNAPGWGDAGVVVPWRLYENYGDTRILREHLEAARRFIDGIERDNPNLLWKNNTGNNYGDWLHGDTIKSKDYPAKGGELPKDIFSTAFFAYSTGLVAKMCAALDMKEESAHYTALAGKITEAWRKAYLKEDGHIEGDTQAGYALALHFNLLPEALRPKAAQYMVEGIQRYDNRLSTGFHSTYRMMLELTRWGHHDVACALAESTRFPSWGYTIGQGATTIWERWDGYVAGRGFQDEGMNSFAHYSIGAVIEWIYRTLGGINNVEAQPAYKQILLRPEPGGTITWVKSHYDSIRGPIKSDWKLDGPQFQWTVSVPPNTSAELHVPAKDAGSVTENGAPAAKAKGLEFVRMDNGAAVFRAAAGQYALASTR